MTTITQDFPLPEPAFRLRWDDAKAEYRVSKPGIDSCDCYTAEQVRATLEAYCRSQVPTDILAISQRLHTQDNRITADPLFAVQQKRRVYGLDADYCDNAEWILDGETWTPEDGEAPPDKARYLGYIDKWEFVTGCFTEQGCKDYIAINGHNLHEPRIYAYGSYRNAEFIALREWLMSLALSQNDKDAP